MRKTLDLARVYSLVWLSGAFLCSVGPSAEPSVTIGQSLTVTAGDQPRSDAPASVAIAVKPEETGSLRLIETTGGAERTVPCQVEPGTPPRLWWIVQGELAPQTKRTYRVEQGAAASTSRVSVEQNPDSLVVRVGDLPVLQYNSRHVDPPAEIDSGYGRSAYIHPLWTPAGAVVTDQFPPNHPHQSGLFLAYTKTTFEDRKPNFWELLGGTGRVRFKAVHGVTSGPVFGEFQVEHEHVDLTIPQGKVALSETWTVRVWNIGGRETGYWICDLTSTSKCATASPLRLPEYHYGGMALRGARNWDEKQCRFQTSEGKDRIAGNHTRPRWCDLSGPVGEQTAGLAFLASPGNFRAPEPLRIHPTMPYMVYTPSYLGDWEIAPGQPHVSRYRFVPHDGDMPAATTDALWLNFAQPLVATMGP
jgi:hypothetical protein